MQPRKLNYMFYLILLLFLSLILTGFVVTINVRQKSYIRSLNGSGHIEQDYRYHFAMIVNDDSNDFWSSVYNGAAVAGEENGAYVELMGSSLNASYSKQNLMNIAIAAHVDGILLEADGSEEIAGLVEAAGQEGIPVVTLLRDISDSSRISYVGISYYNLGQQYAEQIMKILKERAENTYDTNYVFRVMLLTSSNISESSRTIIQSTIQETINELNVHNYKIILDTRMIDDLAPFEAEESIRNIFITEKNLPDIFVCLDETSSVCVYQALVDHNQVGKTELIAYYTNAAITSGIEKNVIFASMAVDTESIGRNGVEALAEYLDTGFSSVYYSVDTSVVDHEQLMSLAGETDEQGK